MHREFGEYEKANQLHNDLAFLCQKSPDTLADVYETCLILRTGLALKTRNHMEELEAYRQLVDITSKTSGPFASETIGHKISFFRCASQEASTEGRKYKAMMVNSDKCEGVDNAIWNAIGLTLDYKYVREINEIDALWHGTIEHMLLEESPGIGMHDSIYAFEVAAEESKRSTYQEASNIMQRQVARLRDLKTQMTQRTGLSKGALPILLKGFWSVVDSIGPFASPVEPRSIILNIKSGQKEEQESRRQLGQTITTKIHSSRSHAKPYMLFMCLCSLELYYYGERTRESSPLNGRNIYFLLKMATKQSGEAHGLSLRMHFVNAIISQLSNVTIRREQSEACIIEHCFKDIGKPGDRISLSAGAVLEHLNAEYKKRGWYLLCTRLYEIAF